VAQDDYYYEIQLTNKQLVFYFMAGASGLILSFLAGIMVGRGVDASPEVQAASRPAVQDTIVREEEPARSAPTTAPAASHGGEEAGYSPALESDKPNDTALEGKSAKAGTTIVTAAKTAAPTAAPPVATLPPMRRSAEVSRPAAPPAAAGPVVASAPAGDSAAGFTIQVGAYKDKGGADSIAGSLKKKGYAAYVVTGGDSGLFSVRVGSYATRADADKIKARLHVEQKYDPYIVSK
jgi:cell division protein FtsN